MKKILLFALPLLAIIAVSCEKDGKTYSGTTKLVKEIDFDGELLITFEYNSDGKVAKIHVDNDEHCYEFQYSDNTVVIVPDKEERIVYTLDKDGYVISENDRQYEYENGYISKIYEDGDICDTYIWKNGNIYPNDINVEYSNIENIINIELSIFLEIDCPHLFYTRHKGLSSKNLVSAIDNDTTVKYKLDKDGAPVQMTIYNKDFKGEIYTEIITITYVE